MYFTYGSQEVEALCKKDRKLAAVIRQIGHIQREVETDLFTSVVRHIVGQQISSAALATVWGRLLEKADPVSAETLLKMSAEELQKIGITHRKAEYIREFAQTVASGAIDLQELARLPDEQFIRSLSKLKGIGVWTAEMILIFCLQRPDVLSYDDLAIQRGLRMVYRHKTIDRERFLRYRRRFHPYATVAGLYLWAVAGGAIPGLTDPAAKQKNTGNK